MTPNVTMNSDPPHIDLNYLPPLPTDRSIGIGCIGAGFIMADCHLPAYRNAGLSPLAIASRNGLSARAAASRHAIPKVYDRYEDLLDDAQIQVIDVAVPPDMQFPIIEAAVKRKGHIRGILAQKPLGLNYHEAKRIVEMCENAGIVLAVNQNMRFDHSVRACKHLLDRGELGPPVLATIEMRAIPHWMPWQQRLGWLTLRIMSIHHLDTFRYWLGNPARVFASVRPDPRTAGSFAHDDGICLYILEYENGARASGWDDVWTGPAREGAASDIGIRWRVEGAQGLARGTLGWPSYPARTPSTLDFTTVRDNGRWHQPRWEEAWFPDAFVGPMADLLIALEESHPPTLSGRDNLDTMALVDACYLSAKEHRAVEMEEVMQ
jgi:predicted dehydrogenase